MTEYVYTSSDGRQRMIRYNNKERKTISYPRVIMENHLGRKLLPDEDVHHIDGDVTNNNVSNLQVVKHNKHCAMHEQKYFDKEVRCFWCGKKFILTAKQQQIRHGNINRKNRNGENSKIFCSRSCGGKYGRMIQEKMKVS